MAQLRIRDAARLLGVSDDTLRQLYDLVKFGPTAANSGPARFQFVRSAEGKQKLLGCVSAGNVAKVTQAPVTVIIGMDLEFHEQLPRLFPHADARSWFAQNHTQTRRQTTRDRI